MNTIGVNTFSRKSSFALINNIPFDTVISMLSSAFKLILDENDLEEIIIDTFIEKDLDLWFENIEKIMELEGKGITVENIKVQNLVHNLYDIASHFFSPSMMMFE